MPTPTHEVTLSRVTRLYSLAQVTRQSIETNYEAVRQDEEGVMQAIAEANAARDACILKHLRDRGLTWCTYCPVRQRVTQLVEVNKARLLFIESIRSGERSWEINRLHRTCLDCTAHLLREPPRSSRRQCTTYKVAERHPNALEATDVLTREQLATTLDEIVIYHAEQLGLKALPPRLDPKGALA